MSGPPESRHIPAEPPGPGYRVVASPALAPLRFLEFALLTLAEGAPPFAWESGDREAVLYLIGGVCEYAASGGAGSLTGRLDSRPGIFEGPPSALFLPPGMRAGLSSPAGGAHLAIFAAPPLDRRPPRSIGPDEIGVRHAGRDTWARRVSGVADGRIASRLLIGETHNRAGHWSSYPPHKHDRAAPGGELPMEEIYHYFLRPPEGFGLQMVYTSPEASAPFERIYRVCDGDTVVLPRGYHPVVAAGGYELAYLWAISGERVDYGAWADDPAHAWLLR